MSLALKTRLPRQYQVRIVFEDGKATSPFIIAAFDAQGAAAKLAGLISDQPVAVVAVEMKLVNQSLIMAANGGLVHRLKSG